MAQALGSLLPLGVAAAVSTVPIMVTILLLLSDRRNQTALPYLIGWVVGTLFLVTVGTILASSIPQPRRRGPDTIVGVLEIVIGCAIVALGVISIRRHSERAGRPGTRRGPVRSVPSARGGRSAWVSR